MKQPKGLADLGDLKQQLKTRAEQERQAALQKQEQERQARQDANLFRDNIGAVTRIKAPDTAPPVRPPVAQRPASPPRRQINSMTDVMLEVDAWSDEFEHAAKGSDDGSYVAPGSSPDLLQRLRKGQWPVQATLDLHGKQRDQARDALARFLHESKLARLRCVLVVHGQGFNSRDGAVLPDKVRSWLAQSDQVRGYCPSPPALGGAGALLVLLAEQIR